MSEFARANVKDDTSEYVGELVKVMASPYQKSVSGRMPAPTTTDGAVVFVSEGSGTISCQNAAGDVTTSAVAVYDPEATLRNGQAAVLLFQRKSDGTVNKVNKINIGRPSTDFLSAGVISSTLTSTNTSAIDTIAGSQTQATLYSVPKSASSVGATDILQFASDKEKHVVSNVSSKSDNTTTNVISDHNGSRMALLRDGAASNTADMEIAFSASTSSAQGFIASGADLATVVGGTGSGAYDLAANLAKAVWDSGRDAAYSPLTLATYKSHIKMTAEYNPSAAGAFVYTVVGLDASGAEIAGCKFDFTAVAETNNSFDFQLEALLVSSTVPISRVCVFLKSVHSGTIQLATSVHSGIIHASEETADIPNRGLHFCVFEGLNPGASLNFHAANVIAGIPDSSNAFIASANVGDKVFDYNVIQNLLQTFKYTFPRAFTGLGSEVANLALAEWFDMEGMQHSLNALSFKRIGLALKKVVPIAKIIRSGASKAADIAKPVMREGGMVLVATGIGGARGRAAGAGMIAGAEALDAAQRARILE
jgi:hypothetical protein